MKFTVILACLIVAAGSRTIAAAGQLRVATFNVQDVRSDDLVAADNIRLKKVASIIQQVRPDVILLNEIAYDAESTPAGQNGQRFVRQYLSVSQGVGLKPLRYQSFMAPCNTGVNSGLDLDGNGRVVEQAGSREYANDCWGYGTAPGQYAMTLLVREGLRIQKRQIRTFQQLRWSAMPDALQPRHPQTGAAWFGAAVWPQLRLSSKSHWDIPVRVGDRVIHMLCSHPTPPVFDGPEDRNGCRNHDEIRFWAEYLNGAEWMVDDAGKRGGLADDQPFVILGDLNADPDEGDSRQNPIQRHLLTHRRVRGTDTPKSGLHVGPNRLDPDDTAAWGLRVDYALPSRELTVVASGVVRNQASDPNPPSDHFLVWIDLRLP